MKFCTNCGHGSEEGKRFCVKCGNSLQSEAEQTASTEQVNQAPPGGYQQANQAPPGGYQQVNQAPPGGYQQVNQAPPGGYQQVNQAPPKKKKSPLLVLGIMGIFACGAWGATYLMGDGNESGILSVFQGEPDLEPFPYDLEPLLDEDALMTALEEQDEDYFEEWMEVFEEIPSDYYYDLAIGAGSIAAVYLATNLETVVDEMLDLPIDLDFSLGMLDEFYGFSDEIWKYIPTELDSMTITWDTSVRAKSGEIPFSLVVNGEEFVPDPDIDEDELEELVLEGDPSDWSLDEMLDLLSFFYFVAEEELAYLVEYDSKNELFDFLYASTSWAKVEPFVLEIERTSSGNFDVYTSSAHWEQLGFSYKNGKVSDALGVAPLVAGVVAPQYVRFVESSGEQADISAANEIRKAMIIAMATMEGDHSGTFVTWSGAGMLTYSDPDSMYAKEVHATVGNFPAYSSEFGRNNPVTFGISNQNGVPIVYVDRSCDAKWAESLDMPWGP